MDSRNWSKVEARGPKMLDDSAFRLQCKVALGNCLALGRNPTDMRKVARTCRTELECGDQNPIQEAEHEGENVCFIVGDVLCCSDVLYGPRHNDGHLEVK